MKKRLTLKTVWEECVKMWNALPEPLPEGFGIIIFKRKWINNSKWKDESIKIDCFFCEYSVRHAGHCRSCPGKLVDPEFMCGNAEYDYYSKPLAFRDKINELNKKRLAKSKKK